MEQSELRSILNQIAAGKTGKQIGKTAKTFADKGQKTILITRLLKEKANIVKGFIYIQCFETGNIDVMGEFPNYLKKIEKAIR